MRTKLFCDNKYHTIVCFVPLNFTKILFFFKMKQLKFCENWENVAIPAWEMRPIKRTEFEKLSHDFVITDKAKFFVMFQCPFSVPKLTWVEFIKYKKFVESWFSLSFSEFVLKTMCAVAAYMYIEPHRTFLGPRDLLLRG